MQNEQFETTSFFPGKFNFYFMNSTTVFGTGRNDVRFRRSISPNISLQYGQLGEEKTTNHALTPRALFSSVGIKEISTGDAHTLILKTDGSVESVGFNGVKIKKIN